MPSRVDWISRLLEMMPVRGHLDVRCTYGAPWRIIKHGAAAGEIPYYVVIDGTAILKNPGGGSAQHLETGDILVLFDGGAHVLDDGSGLPPAPVRSRVGFSIIASENDGSGDRLDMLCGRFILVVPNGHLLRTYLPPRLIVRANAASDEPTGTQLTGTLALMRKEAEVENIGGHAMLSALSSVLFTLALRFVHEADEPPTGLLALARHPLLAPALAALFHRPAYPWRLHELARLCNMSRATMARHFQERLGHSPIELLADIRMTLAANELRRPLVSTGAVAELVGYHSEAAFQRAFKQHMGMTPGRWRRTAISI
jgi:AraC family transcriptional activator of mtrCDE